MAKLRATIELAAGGFLSQINRVLQASDRAAKSVEGVSTAADKAETSLDKAGKSGKKAKEGFENAGKGAENARKKVKGLGDEVDKTKSKAERVAGVLGKLFAAKTAMDVGGKLLTASDNYVNANSRLDLINRGTNGNVINSNLQNDVYASAQRSRASYENTANGVASLGLNAASAFKNQNELIGFVESINKQFALAHADTVTAAGAMTQLTQAMGAGALRGEELNSVLGAAPSIARNIEKYMGWAEGSIKKYAEKGMLSAEIVKNAQLAAMDEIDRKFNSMPLTWSQLWTQAMNAIQRASAPFLMALNWMANNMDVIGPILLGIAAGLGVYAAFTYGAAAAQWVLNAAAGVWNALCMMNPAGLMAIGVIVLVAALYAGVAAFNKITGSSVSATGIIVGGLYVVGALIVNLGQSAANIFIGIWSAGCAVASNIQTAFGNSIKNVQSFFYNLLATAIEVIGGIAQKLNALPFVNIDVAGLTGKAEAYRAKAQSIASQKGSYESIGNAFNKGFSTYDTFQNGWAKDAYGKGYSKGSALSGKVSNFISGGINGMDFSSIGSAGKPATVQGKGKNGSMNVKLEDEDIDYLRELAERDYVARIAQNTLAPNIQVTFTGDINQEMDYEKIGPAVAQILQDEIETAPEGLY